MTLKSWADGELKRFRHDPDFEVEELLIGVNERWLARMNDLGWRKADLAERLGVSRAFISKLLNGHANITLLTLVKISNALGLKLDVSTSPRHVEDWMRERPAHNR